MQPVCSYCVLREATTADHIPPKVCFPKPRPNLITVPACESCNNQFSNLDEEFASFLSIRVGSDSSVTQRLHEKNKRIIRHNKRLRRAIIDRSTKVWLIDEGNFIKEAYQFKWDGKGHDQMVCRLIRGLFYHVFRRPLPLTSTIKGAWSKPFHDKGLLEIWNGGAGENIGDGGQFRYRYNHTLDAPDTTIWMMTFYDRHFATGSTGFVYHT